MRTKLHKVDGFFFFFKKLMPSARLNQSKIGHRINRVFMLGEFMVTTMLVCRRTSVHDTHKNGCGVA